MARESDVLRFYAFSADKPPGAGVGDQVGRPADYAELAKHSGWRRMFTSLWSRDPFFFEGRQYLSFEHALQAAKFRVNGRDDRARSFSMASRSGPGTLEGSCVKRAGRTPRLTKSELDRWGEMRPAVKAAIYRAKFTPSSRPGQALLATGEAQLVNAGPRIKTIRCLRLEALRAELRRALAARGTQAEPEGAGPRAEPEAAEHPRPNEAKFDECDPCDLCRGSWYAGGYEPRPCRCLKYMICGDCDDSHGFDECAPSRSGRRRSGPEKAAALT